MFDLLIKNGSYPDFEKNMTVKANIGVEKGKITYIGDETPDAAQVIDAEGRIVSPGFIDIHMHEENFDEGHNWVIARLMAKMGVTLAVGGNCGVMRQPVKKFKTVLNELGGCPVNYIILSGYNYYRNNVLGYGHLEEAPKEAWEKIRGFMKEDLAEGAWGISFGIEYDPGMSYEEILYAVNASEEEKHIVSAHYRSDTLHSMDSVKEMIQLQADIKQKFQISHLSSCSALGQMTEALQMINEAIDRDPRLSYDTYPYNAFSTYIGSEAFYDGCMDEWKRTFADILLTEEPYKNVRCTEEIYEDARKNYPYMLAVAFVMDEEEIADAITNPYGMVASDAIISNGKGHPRAGGTFPRVLGKYVREEKRLSLMDALRKMTLEPAKRLELEERKGVIRPGADADITIFDPETISDGPDFESLDIPNKGIDYVIVNGKIVVEGTELVDETAGKFISFFDR